MSEEKDIRAKALLVKMNTQEREDLGRLAKKLGVKSHSRALRMALYFTLKNHK